MTSTQVTVAAGTTDDSLLKQLQEWTQSSITNLYNLDQDPQTQSLFTPDAQITINGDKLSPEQYDEQIKELRAGATKIDTRWEDIVTIPEESYSILFKGSYTITRFSKLRLLGGPMETLTHVVLEARVVEIDSDRKITSLLQTETFDRPPVHLPPVQAGSVSSQGDASKVDSSHGS